MQARDVMSRDVITIGPDGSVKRAAGAEADVPRHRLPPDPRLHVRRAGPSIESAPPLLVDGVLTAGARTVEASADIADVARMFVDERELASTVVGVVSSRVLPRSADPAETIPGDPSASPGYGSKGPVGGGVPR